MDSALYDVRVKFWYVRKHLVRDVMRRVRWGDVAPRHAQLIEINPADCHDVHLGWRRQHSGRVHGGEWDLDVSPIDDLAKVRACRLHFEGGMPWQETGIYDFMMEQISTLGGRYDGCETFGDVVRRYERLDRVFEQASHERRLREPRELAPGFRASSGMVIHFDRNARPLFSGCGVHRMAIAKLLRLPLVPATVGVVHVGALNHQWRESLPSWN